jgi:hypothetical protein
MARVEPVANRLGAYNDGPEALKELKACLLRLTRENGENLVRCESASGGNTRVYRCCNSVQIDIQRKAQSILKQLEKPGNKWVRIFEEHLQDNPSASKRSIAYGLVRQEVSQSSSLSCPRTLTLALAGGNWVPQVESENCQHLTTCMNFTNARQSDVKAAISNVVNGAMSNPNRNKRPSLEFIAGLVASHSEGAAPSKSQISRITSGERFKVQQEQDKTDWDLLIPMCEKFVEENPGSLFGVRSISNTNLSERIRIFYSDEKGEVLKLSPKRTNAYLDENLDDDEMW